MARKKNKDEVRTLRYVIGGAVAVLVLGVFTWGALYSTGVTNSDEFIEGEHYQTVENPPRRRAGDPVVVAEYFSYGCIHCKNFDPIISEWAQTLPQGVTLERRPVVYSPAWLVLGQSYLALEITGALEQNHERLFRAVHDARRQFATTASVADFVEGRGVSREAFLRALNSSTVRRKLAEGESSQRRFGVTSIPSLVVNDTYVINMDIGRRESLEVAKALIAKIQAETAVEDPSPTEEGS